MDASSVDAEDLTEIVLKGPAKAKIVRLKVKTGEQVSPGQVVLLYELDEENGGKKTDGKLKASKIGSIVEVLVKAGDSVVDGQCLMRMRVGCLHPVVMKDMCADCGADLRLAGPSMTSRPVTGLSKASVPMIHNIPELMVSAEQAARIGADDLAHLIDTRRLVLLVDLDQTLIHTTMAPVSNSLKDVHHFQLQGPHSPRYHTKLRPGTMEFLAAIKPYFQLHICTFGNRVYAHHIAKILDPEEALFGHRILSRDEILDPFLKTANMKSLFPCGDDMVCIIDDREDVWNFAQNLIHVRPYAYFKNTGDINAPFPKNTPAPSDPSSPKTDAIKSQYDSKFADQSEEPIEDADDYLLYLQNILINIHKEYYRKYDAYKGDKKGNLLPSVKEVVPLVRKRVLAGCRLVFSGFFPSEGHSMERNKAEALVGSFGGKVTGSLVRKEEDEKGYTTHLVAANQGTDKVKKARQLSYVSIVSAAWLKECVRRWERVSEELYPVENEPDAKGASKPPILFHELGPGHGHPRQLFNSADPDNQEKSRFLAGLSDADLDSMDHEVDDAIDEEDADEEIMRNDVQNSVNDSDSNLPDGEPTEDDEEDAPSRHNGSSLATITRGLKRKRVSDELDFEAESSDSSDSLQREAKHFKPEDFDPDASSSSSDGDDQFEFSDDDDNTLGQMARQLDRDLSQ